MNLPGQKCGVAVIAPAGPVARDNALNGLQFLARQGFEVKVMPHVFANSGEESYLASAIEDRVADLQQAWLDPEVEIIWALRGGFGCIQLLDKIDWALLQQRSFMPVIGFSDLTALHCAMSAVKCGIPVWAPMAARAHISYQDDPGSAYTLEYFNKLRNLDAYNIEPFDGKFEVINSGLGEGRVFTANLAVLSGMLGTGFMPNLHGTVLILEDLNEPAYKLERYLQQLRLAGVLKQLSALVFGYLSDCATPEQLQRVIRRATEDLNIPVVMNLPFGHELPFVSLSNAQTMRVDHDQLSIVNTSARF